MKKELVLAGLMSSKVLFGFSKMEPLCQFFKNVITKNGSVDVIKTYPIYSIERVSLLCSDYEALYLFLYDRRTGYSIGTYLPIYYTSSQYNDFLLGKKKSKHFNPKFFILQENLGLMVRVQTLGCFGCVAPNSYQYVMVGYDKSGNLYIKDPADYGREIITKDIFLNDMYPKKTIKPAKKDAHITQGMMHLWNKYKNIWNQKNPVLPDDFFDDCIRIHDSFITQSNIKVENKKDKVLIDGRDFQKALRKYYNLDGDDRNLDIVQSINNRHRAGGKTSYDLGKIGYNLSEQGRNDGQLELLSKSKILRVYAVLKGKQGKNSLVWGLAEDKESKEPFHWLTDLKADVSVLVNQYKRS